MSNPLIKMIAKLRESKGKTNRPPGVTPGGMAQLADKLKKIKMLLLISMLEDEGSGFSMLPGAENVFGVEVGGAVNPKSVDDERLRANTTNRLNLKTKKKEFLLHRATIDSEYESYAMPTGSSEIRPTEYDTRSDTEWFVEFRSAEAARVAANPVVSCWVPEDKIVKIRGMRADCAGQWGDMGKSPFAEEIKVTVKPGSYEIYAELKS